MPEPAIPSSDTQIKAKAGAAQVLPLQETAMQVFNKKNLQQLAIQTKLSVSQIGDPHEKQADAVADRVMRMPEQSFVQRKCDDCGEEEKISRKPLFQNMMPPVQAKSEGQATVSEGAANSIQSSRGSGSGLDDQTQSFMSNRMGSDFSGVKIHTDNEAVQFNRGLNAKAFTIGQDVYFNEGQYQPNSSQGKQLLVHELTHTLQQTGNGSAIQRVISDPEVETKLKEWADAKQQALDKNDDYYPHLLWDFIYTLTHDSSTYSPIPKPKDATKLKIWERNWGMAEVVAKWLTGLKGTGKNDSVKSAAESRLNGILLAMLEVGLVTKAMAQAGGLDASNKKELYEKVLQNPDSASAAELATIISALAATEKDPGNLGIVQQLINVTKDNVDKLDATKTKAVLKALHTAYPNHDTLVDATATLLMMNPSIRTAVADAMNASEFGSPDFLFKVLKHKYFVEPGYAGGALIAELIPENTDSADYDAARQKKDMPFVYKYKQQYYVQYLIDLCAAQSIVIPKLAKMDFAGLKAWLETNTNSIGDAVNKKYPADPDAVFEIYKNIADIFFYHPVDHSLDIKPDQSGGIGHLKEAKPVKEKYTENKVEKERYVGPSASRMVADCDVYATYAMRLFTHSGFEPIGYLGIKPKGSDTSRAAHAAALIRKNKTYYIINNKGILKTDLSDDKAANDKKPDALKTLYKKALEDAYGTPYPTDLDVYYDDADATGKMSDKFRTEDASIFRNDLK